MTTHLTGTGAEQLRTESPDGQHRHGSACYWSTDDCRWQCASSPLLGYALEIRTLTGPPARDRGAATS
jgi:hypothetical protein